MASDAERDVMGLLLTTNAELVSGVLRRTTRPDGSDVLAAIAATRSLDLIVDDVLHTLVRQARAEGHTWAAIGDVLRVSRQAAFQRFGGATGGDVADAQVMMPLPGAEQKAARIFDLCVRERWEELRAEFDDRMKALVPAAKLVADRQHIEAQFGPFLEMGTPAVMVRSGYTVVDVPLAFERGDRKGRVTFNADGQVAGLFFRPTDAL